MKWLVSILKKVVDYVRGTYRELRFVTWPTREELVRYTILIVITLIAGVIALTGFDYGMQQLSDRYLIR